MKRFRALLAGIATLATTLLGAHEARAGDPYLRWFTVVTPHFRVTYHRGLEDEAQRVATLAEAVYSRLTPQLGWQPTQITEVLLTDITDAANGSATALPYNAVRLFATAPDDLSPLGDYDDWYSELVTHEYTHILHVDNISGIPELVNRILGKTSAPNQVQPRWVLEGLAVTLETEHTGGGRLHSSNFDMILRADVLEDRLARLDQISNSARRWPTGNLWYLYGGEFIGWITDVYGPETFGAVASDYGSNIIPWGINRSIRRATGRTYPELYRGWKRHLERKYADQVAEVKRRGLREGTRLTHRGRVAQSPRWVPECARSGRREEILYYVDDGHSEAGFWRVPLDARDRADESDEELMARAGGHTASYEPGCGFVYDSVAPSRRRYYFGDLFRQPKGTRSERGLAGSKERLTIGRRARDPDVSPDGRHVAYVTNRAGTSTLRIADMSAAGDIEHERALVPSARWEEAYTPRFSHDGKHVAYSVWTYGGYRDIRVVEVATGKFYEVTHDVAIDQEPSFSPDDTTLYFTSDRSGIPNVYAYEIASGKLSQVTNVRTGAYMPEPSPDGSTLAYIGYTSDGFDLYTMPIDRSRWLAPPPAPGPRNHPHPDPGARIWPVKRYNPLATLGPRAYTLDYGLGAFGNTLKVTTTGSDIVGLHSFSATVLTAFDKGQPSGSINYGYHELPFDFVLSAFRSAAPRKGYRYGEQEPIFTETFTGVTTGVGYTEPGEFDAESIAIYYTIGEFAETLPVANLGDPDALVPVDPPHGFLGLVSVGYGYTNADGTLYGLGAERGFSVGGGLDFAARETGSQDTLAAVNARATAYIPMPWLRHHTLALNLEGASAVGSYPRRGLYYTGGFVTDQGLSGIIDAYNNGIRQSSFVLRGYEPAKFIGQQYNLANAEYRFPILYADRGISTLPVFLRTLSATVFADYGGAFDTIDVNDPLSQYHLGVGGELWIDLILGYHAEGLIRLGYAKGFGSEAIPGGQKYVVVASAF